MPSNDQPRKTTCHPDWRRSEAKTQRRDLLLPAPTVRVPHPSQSHHDGWDVRRPPRHLFAFLLLLLAAPILAQDAPSTPDASTLTLRVQTDIVLTNIIVRDKKSNVVVRGLKATDFTVLENNKPQRISTFDFQSVDEAATLAENNTAAGRALNTKSVADLLNNNALGATPAALRDHRLIVLFFDLSSMQPEDIDRSVAAAQKYISSQMQPADLVTVVSLATGLSIDQDFTADKSLLTRAVGKYNGTEGTGFANGGQTGSTDGTADTGSTFAVDDTEYNSLNTDRELFAISTIAKSLERIDQRKSLLYFSGGLTRNGIENQASMRAATNAAVRANMSLYPVDTRGLQALPPVGDASTGSLRGVSAYNGGSMQSQLDANFGSQETLGTLASDTGGKFFSDSNDFTAAFSQVQHDTEAYYILGFRSANTARDGAFRHLTIKVNRPDVKLDYRPGYYAAADFKHQRTEDREQALDDQMRSDSPATDVPLYLQALFFREPGNRAFVPVSLIIPGSAIPFLKTGDRSKATLDIVGQVKNAAGILVGSVRDKINLARDNVKLAVDANQQVAQKNIQYSTGFTLAPGRYHLKFVIRENQTGNLGSFETDIQVPDLAKAPLKLSSIVLSDQRSPDPEKNSAKHPSTNPLTRDGQQWIPNVAHVFRADQHLFLLYEVYDPTRVKSATAQGVPHLDSETSDPSGSAQKPLPNSTPANSPGLTRRPSGALRILTSIEFLQNGSKVFETPVVEATTLNTPDRNAVSFAFDVPLTTLKPGIYIAQVNVIDDAGGTFTFSRLALRILPPAPATAPPAAKPPPLQQQPPRQHPPPLATSLLIPSLLLSSQTLSNQTEVAKDLLRSVQLSFRPERSEVEEPASLPGTPRHAIIRDGSLQT